MHKTKNKNIKESKVSNYQTVPRKLSHKVPNAHTMNREKMTPTLNELFPTFPSLHLIMTASHQCPTM